MLLHFTSSVAYKMEREYKWGRFVSQHGDQKAVKILTQTSPRFLFPSRDFSTGNSLESFNLEDPKGHMKS